MGTGTLTIYSASAGSGKTFRLAGIYLSKLFRSKYNYRKILAVTFTNKATAEMKNRILDQLFLLSTGKESKYLSGLMKDTGMTEPEVRNKAEEILYSLLHDFSRFSVSTIDAFFQKVLRAFAREAGLHSGYNIELDHNLILSSAVDEMIASSPEDNKLQEWLKDYVLSNLEEEKNWNLKTSVMKLSEELFKENFKILSETELSKLENKEFLLDYIKKIRSIIHSFETKLNDLGTKAEELLFEYELSAEMFYQKSRGIPSYIRSLSSGKIVSPGSAVRQIFNDPPRWSSGKIHPRLQSAINKGLDTIIKEAVIYDDDKRLIYESAKVIQPNMYALGILSDVLKRVRRVAGSENSFLLSDAGEVLRLITKADQTPFIYEKIGNQYENYMIDEFQDTSILQWHNFNPLIINSMGEGHDNIVVGDIKQSIYRWRNSDWQILGRMKKEMVDNKRFLSEPLNTNWRSRSNIISFNNSLFSVIPQQVEDSFPGDQLSFSFTELYKEAVQDDPEPGRGGYVRLEIVDDESEGEKGLDEIKTDDKKKWSQIVLDRLPALIEELQIKGYRASDIGILVRERREGEDVLRRVIEYGAGCAEEQKKKFNYNIVSNDSLTLSKSAVVNFIAAVIKLLNNPGDQIAQAEMKRFYLVTRGWDNPEEVPLFSDSSSDSCQDYYPVDTAEFLERARNMPLFEAVENIVRHFDLGSSPHHVAYLNTFQDLVMNFSKNRNADFNTFLEWWESTGVNKSIVLPDDQDAIKVFTIHKSKGLEFSVTILPFLSWDVDHKNLKQPVLWVRPQIPPFNELGILPVRYSNKLVNTVFSDDYYAEKCASFLDNINLLYVALTRAKDVLWGFLPGDKNSKGTIAEIIKNAIEIGVNNVEKAELPLRKMFNPEKGIFELGIIPEKLSQTEEKKEITLNCYTVENKPGSLKLKLHGENYFSEKNTAVKQKINYGKMMHEVFEDIATINDIGTALKKLVMAGKITKEEADDMENKIAVLLSSSPVSEWFAVDNKVLTEKDILLPSGVTRRPDRILLRENKTIVVDFKFGEENKRYVKQLQEYKMLLSDMGYHNIESYIWYVDNNKVVSV